MPSDARPMRQVAVWGAAGHARVVADVLRLAGWDVVGFLDNVAPQRAGERFAVFAQPRLLGVVNEDADRYLSALVFLDRQEQADRRVAEWLALADTAELTDAQTARLHAAVQRALGTGYGFWRRPRLEDEQARLPVAAGSVDRNEIQTGRQLGLDALVEDAGEVLRAGNHTLQPRHLDVEEAVVDGIHYGPPEDSLQIRHVD